VFVCTYCYYLLGIIAALSFHNLGLRGAVATSLANVFLILVRFGWERGGPRVFGRNKIGSLIFIFIV
jgi:hypothetical protein